MSTDHPAAGLAATTTTSTTRHGTAPVGRAAPFPVASATAAPMDDRQTAETFEQIFFELRKVIVGQTRLLERLLVGLLCRGHCLLESVPGLAKTLAAETLADVVGGSFSRIQFTPDLLPSDIAGTRIYRGSTETFDVEFGPVFVNFLLTDEINRAPAKVQSALLEVMAEQQVTIGGVTHQVPNPFFVVATQNPIESEGVYQLPDAQRDRFMMKIVLDYPTADEEMMILDRMSISPPIPSRSSRSTSSPRCSAGRQRVRRSLGQPVRRRPRAVHPLPRSIRSRRPVDRHRSRRQSSRVAQPRARRPGARHVARPLVHDAAGRVRPRARDPPPPAPAHLRRARP